MNNIAQTYSTGRNTIVSKRINLSREEREALVIEVTINMLKGSMTKGEAVKYLRLNLFSVNQADYAKMVGISRKVLSEIENGKGNYTEAILQKVFRPLGMVVTVIPRDLAILDKARSACGQYKVAKSHIDVYRVKYRRERKAVLGDIIREQLTGNDIELTLERYCDNNQIEEKDKFISIAITELNNLHSGAIIGLGVTEGMFYAWLEKQTQYL